MDDLLNLNERCIIGISGNDRFKFLQGIVTNDVNKINNNVSIYLCFLTPQGKYLADAFAISSDNMILLDIHENNLTQLIQKLNMYKLRADIEIKDLSNEYIVASSLTNTKYNRNNLTFVDPRNDKLGLRHFIKKSEMITISNNSSNYEVARIKLKIPEGEKDLISGKSFPLEFGLDKLNAIDFKKGCYIGQELISRTHYRGIIRKKIYLVTTEYVMPSKGQPIEINNKKIGIMCSSSGSQGLALIRTEDYKKSLSNSPPICDGVTINIM